MPSWSLLLLLFGLLYGWRAGVNYPGRGFRQTIARSSHLVATGCACLAEMGNHVRCLDVAAQKLCTCVHG